jgi:hypothetical protein
VNDTDRSMRSEARSLKCLVIPLLFSCASVKQVKLMEFFGTNVIDVSKLRHMLLFYVSTISYKLLLDVSTLRYLLLDVSTFRFVLLDVSTLMYMRLNVLRLRYGL